MGDDADVTLSQLSCCFWRQQSQNNFHRVAIWYISARWNSRWQPMSGWAVHSCSIVIMSNKDPLDLILRRLQVERRKGNSIEEMYDIITTMIRNQKMVDGTPNDNAAESSDIATAGPLKSKRNSSE